MGSIIHFHFCGSGFSREEPGKSRSHDNFKLSNLTKQKIEPLLPLFSEARIPDGLLFTWETIL